MLILPHPRHLAVDVFPVADAQDRRCPRSIVHVVDDAVVPLAEAVLVRRTGEFLYTMGTWAGREFHDSLVDPRDRVPREVAEFFVRGRGERYVIGGHPA